MDCGIPVPSIQAARPRARPPRNRALPDIRCVHGGPHRRRPFPRTRRPVYRRQALHRDAAECFLRGRHRDNRAGAIHQRQRQVVLQKAHVDRFKAVAGATLLRGTAPTRTRRGAVSLVNARLRKICNASNKCFHPLRGLAGLIAAKPMIGRFCGTPRISRATAGLCGRNWEVSTPAG